jgi:chromosome segregation protein
MRINRLELFGFKSFPDRTAFEFGSGISCVVGPNGSGKSNVVDALRWVIGEQSARSLRGKEMSDVIFAGSAVRSPVGFAEVTLTLGVGEGEPFPGDFASFEQLEVGRRLYRDGTSEYLINRVKARRRDIVDLFLDTGVGANLYSFIAQGQVDRIVSQSAAERRSLIDEAAGISRYKVRREEALVRLTATAGQLDRAADVAEEMERRLRTLRRQVIRAGRFRRLRARIRQREILLGVVKYAALSDDRRAHRKRLRTVKDEVGALERSIERIGVDLRTREEEIEAVRGAVSTWRDQAAELEATRREREGAASLHRARHEELVGEESRALERGRTATERLEAEADELATSRTRIAGHLEALEGDELEVAAARHGTATAAVEDARRTLDRLRREAAEIAARRSTLEEALAEHQEPALAPLEDAPDLTPLVAGVEEARQRREAAEAAVVDGTSRVEALRNELRALRQANDARLAAHQAAERAWEEQRHAAERERRRVLEQTRTAMRRAAEQARREAEEARKARVRRLETWLAEARRQIGRQTADAKRRAERDRAELELERRAAARALERREADAVADAVAAVPVAAVEEAERADQAIEVELEEARQAVGLAEEQASSARARRAALDAEWAVLEEQRHGAVPDAWRTLPAFDTVADAGDGRRVARPELSGLPVLSVDDLVVGKGRGIWSDGADRWTVVDDLPAALAHLEAHGPPVASRDGTIRVDADGVVELGWETDDRRARVRAAREEVASVVSEAEERHQVAQRAVPVLVERRRAIRTQLERARAAYVADQERARTAARQALREEESALREAHRVRGEAIDTRLQEALARAERDRNAIARSEAEVRPLAVGESATATPSTVLAAGAALALQPAALPPRPAMPELVAVDEEPVRTAERALTAARQEGRAAREEEERARERLRRAERTRDALQREHQARLDAANRRAAERERIERSLADLVEVEGLEAAARALADARSEAETAREALDRTQARRASVRETVAALRARVTALEESAVRLEQDREAATRDAATARIAAEEALAAAQAATEEATSVAVERSGVQERLAAERDRLSRLLEEAASVRKRLEAARSSLLAGEQERQRMTALVEQHQLDIEGLRKRLGDRYQVSLPGLLDRLGMRRELVLSADPGVQEEVTIGETVLEAVDDLTLTPSMLDDEDRIVTLVGELEELRQAIQKLGEVNLAAEEEYLELDERFQELDRQRADLEASVRSIRAAIAKMNRTCRERFRDAYDRVNEAFQTAYPQLVGGGDARLALTDEEDLLETGVDIFVRPPGKRLQNLTLLSGGEKAMTAIALLLAIFRVRPSPFCVLDEVDAPLDEANGSRFNAMIREMSTMSQFIVITHNRTTMECADVLYGVTMAAPGVSTLVSVALERGSS